MSRPRPRILTEITDRNTYSSEQILAAEGIWAVFYDGAPINLRSVNLMLQHTGSKYKKVSFSNAGHAKNLARKLNTKFLTDRFTVVLLRQGTQIYPDADST